MIILKHENNNIIGNVSFGWVSMSARGAWLAKVPSHTRAS